jgi:sugar phosphate isomerase/epimerase
VTSTIDQRGSGNPGGGQGLAPERCSINTATLGHREPIETVVERVARHGFGGIAPWRRDCEGADIGRVARQIRDAGLAVSGYCRSAYIPRATAAEREAAFVDNCRAIDEAATLGAACFVLVVGGLPTGSRDLRDARSQVEDGIARLVQHARPRRVALAIEPLHPMYAADRSCITSLSEALALCHALDPAGASGLGVAVDAYHVWWDWRLHDDIRKAGDGNRILAFHICDWRLPTRDLLLDRGLMGEGAIDLASLRRSIETAGFAGLAEIEIFSEELWQSDPDDLLARCAQQVATC